MKSASLRSYLDASSVKRFVSFPPHLRFFFVALTCFNGVDAFYQQLLTATDKTCHTTPACDTSEEAAFKKMCRQRKKTLNGNLSTSADMITHI